MTPRKISFDGVREVFPGYGLPPVETYKEERTSLDQLLGEDARPIDPEDARPIDPRRSLDVLRKAVVGMGRALRETGRVATPLHVLLLADYLTIGQIAGRLHLDPRDIFAELTELEQAGIVGTVADGGAAQRYFIVGLPVRNG